MTASYLLNFSTDFLHDVIIPRLLQNPSVSDDVCWLLHSIRLIFNLLDSCLIETDIYDVKRNRDKNNICSSMSIEWNLMIEAYLHDQKKMELNCKIAS